MVVHSGNRDLLDAAQCTWMRAVSPRQIIYVSDDGDIPSSCGLPVPAENVIVEPYSVDYAAVFAAGAQLFREAMMHQDRPWVLVVQPFTFVQPLHLCAYVKSISTRREAKFPGSRENMNSLTKAKLPVYVGRTRNASTELAFLGLHPHVALDNGVLIRTSGLLMVGRDTMNPYRVSNRKDFHASDVSEYLSGWVCVLVSVLRECACACAFRDNIASVARASLMIIHRS
jgi:hypothetical protein